MERVQVLDSETSLPLSAAVDLLDATVNSISTINSGENFRSIFQTIQEIANEAIRSEDPESIDSNRSIVRCVHLWALHTLKNISFSQETGGLYGAGNMSALLSWVRSSLVRSLSPNSSMTSSSACDGLSSPGMKCPPRSKVRQGTPMKDERAVRTVPAVVVSMLQAVLYVLSDAILMRVNSNDVCNFILHLCGVLSVCPLGGTALNVLKSALYRIQIGVQALGGDGERVGERIEKLYSTSSSSENNDEKEVEVEDEDNNYDKENDEDENCQYNGRNGITAKDSPRNTVDCVGSVTVAVTPKKMTTSPDRIEKRFTDLSL